MPRHVKEASHTDRRLRESGPGLAQEETCSRASAPVSGVATYRLTAGKDRHLFMGFSVRVSDE